MLKAFIILAALWTCWGLSSSKHGIRTKRIVNGAPALRIHYQVSLEFDGTHLCGGAILTKTGVLTAGHCVINQKTELLAVRAGSNIRVHGGQLRRVVNYIVHPNFTLTGISDVAVVFLEKSLVFNVVVQPIRMADDSSKFKIGNKAVISGWGYESEGSGYLANKLMFGVVKIVDSDMCKKYFNDFSEGMICAGEANSIVDACNRDSGGPLVVEGILAGVISAGVGCGRKGIPGLYMNVSYYKPWIDYVISHFTI